MRDTHVNFKTCSVRVGVCRYKKVMVPEQTPEGPHRLNDL